VRLLAGAGATAFLRSWAPLSMQTAEFTACGSFARDASVVLCFTFGALKATSLVIMVYFNLYVSVRWFLGLLVARLLRIGIERSRERT
jgi:hypothetical protein